MRRRRTLAIGFFVALTSSSAYADPPAAGAGEGAPRPVAPAPTTTSAPDVAGIATEATCRYVRAVADSQAALLFAPQLFASGGMVTAADSTSTASGSTSTSLQPRIIAGASYSFANLYRGMQTTGLAEAECERERALNKVIAYTYAHGDGQTPASLEARLRVLEAALPRAEEILARARDGVADARVTVDELDATASRVDLMRAALVQTRGQLRAAAGKIPAPTASLPELVAASGRSARAAEERAARLRQSQAWDVSIRGGYDQIFGVNQAVPVFGMVTATFNPGLFWQRSADDRAEAARVDAAKSALQAGVVRAQDTERGLREILRAERERLADVTQLLGELEQRQERIAQVPGDRAKASADFLWLGVVTARAEHAYLKAHVADLARLVGDTSAPAAH